MFQKESRYETSADKFGASNMLAIPSGSVEVVEELTIPAPLPALTMDDLFAKQDGLRLRFNNLKKFILKETPRNDERVAALVKLDEALASLVVGITKEMK